MIAGIKFDQTQAKFQSIANIFGKLYGMEKIPDSGFDENLPLVLMIGKELEYPDQEAKEMIADGMMDAMESNLTIDN